MIASSNASAVHITSVWLTEGFAAAWLTARMLKDPCPVAESTIQ